MVSEIQRIIKNSPNPKLIEEAFELAKTAYKEKQKISGKNYITHAISVALMLSKMGLDPKTIAAAILHDVVDDVPISAKKIELHEIEKKCGQEIAELVEKVSELDKIRYSFRINFKERTKFTDQKIENLRKMFLAIAGDLRVILIELVSRLDNLNYLNYLPEEKQKLYALETLEIFVPISNRLGLGEIRRGLEDLSFFYLFPNRFKWLQNNIKEQYEERRRFLQRFTPQLKKIFKKERLKFVDINYRAKSYWSTYQKLLQRDMDFDKIHDLVALRIIVPDIESCYKALGIIHKYSKPISEEINDYIAKPKPNGYRSLHTTVFCDEDLPPTNFGQKRKDRELVEEKNSPKLVGGEITEIQIRTEEMQKEAEYGVCSHWAYKEKINLIKGKKKFGWTKEIPEFWKTFKINFFVNQVFVFTPKGDVLSFPKGSTPIDFAYAVHSEIGNHCESAKVNGKIAPLSHPLENGDIVEIIINKKREPSRDWLRFVKTSLARSHIRKAIEQSESFFKFPLPHFIKRKISEITAISEKAQKRKEEKIQIRKERPREIYLAGQKGMLVNIAKCCNPEPGDQIQTYLTKHRAAVLHKTSCKNFQKLAKKFPDKIIDASWE